MNIFLPFVVAAVLFSSKTNCCSYKDSVSFDKKMNNSISSLGLQIKEARMLKNISQAQLAEITGLTIYNIECIEENKAVPIRPILAKIEEVLEAEMVIDGF